LFDPLLGLPIPAKNGIRHDAKGRLDIIPADLAEIVADGSLLRKLDLDAKQTYPVTAEDLQNVVALVEASPSSLSYRMKLIESRLVGKQKMVLTTSADEQARRWQSLPQISKARLWTLPYETIARRSRLSSRKICRHLAEFLPFYALPNAPLSTGRLTHLEGRFVGQRGAIGFYQTSRPSREELQYLAISSTSEDLDKVQQDLRKLKKDIVKANNAPPSDNTSSSPFLHQRKQDVEERIAAIDLAKLGEKIQNEYVKAVLKKLTIQTEEERKKLVAKLKEAALRLLAGSIFSGKQDATYWLGLISFQRGNYEAATDYFLKRTLEKHPHGLWSHGARYNLAYSIERSGQIERAALIFQSDPSAPDVYGRLLRARWLTEKTGQ
ncbi:MAG: tetratricopeptide repeat protein, partial [Thermoguttaceae bacterium]